MRKERNAVKVGIITIVVVVLFFLVLLWVSKGVGGDMQSVVIHFPPTPEMPTLVSGSAVLVGGQKVGQVVDAGLEPISRKGGAAAAAGFYLRVEVNMRSKLKLHSDCSAFAESPPLGGDGIIKINLGTADDLFKGDHIEGSEPGGLGAILASLQSEFNGDDPKSLLGQIKTQLDPSVQLSLIGKLHRSLSDLNAMTAALAKELGPGEKATLLAKLQEIADNVNETTRSLRREFDTSQPDVLLQKIHMAMDVLNDGLATVRRITANAEAPVTSSLLSLETTTENFAAQTDPSRPDSLMAELKRTSQQVNSALEDINSVTEATRNLVVLNRENVNRMLVNFKEASDHIKTGVKFVLRHPWRLLNEPSVTELKQQAVFDAARSFSEAAARIDSASADLKALAELHHGNIPQEDPELARILADLKHTQGQYRKAEAEFWRLLQVD